MSESITRALLTIAAGLLAVAAGAAENVEQRVKATVDGGQEGEAVDVRVVPRNNAPGILTRRQAALDASGGFDLLVPGAVGVVDVAVSYDRFRRDASAVTASRDRDVVVRLSWTSGGERDLRLVTDFRAPLDVTVGRGMRYPVAPRVEEVRYLDAAGAFYPIAVHRRLGSGAVGAQVEVLVDGVEVYRASHSFPDGTSSRLDPSRDQLDKALADSLWHVGTLAINGVTAGTAYRVIAPDGDESAAGTRANIAAPGMIGVPTWVDGTAAAGIDPAAVLPARRAVIERILAPPSTYLEIGESAHLLAIGYPDGSEASGPRWLLGELEVISGRDVIYVDDFGIVTAIAAGRATVGATDADGDVHSVELLVAGATIDRDLDGLTDTFEDRLLIDRSAADSDGDGMDDRYEIMCHLDPTRDDADEDFDGDGVTNLNEALAGTFAHRMDSDGDRLSDGAEFAQGSDPLDAVDNDGDGLSDDAERLMGTDAFDADTDGDGVSDLAEVEGGSDPRDRASFPAGYDLDNDGLTVYHEICVAEMPNVFGYAGDYATVETLWDSDGDVIPDGYEFFGGLDPTRSNRSGSTYGDEDGDGLDDYDEFINGTDPTDDDSDGDGVDDGDEVDRGHNPNDEDDIPPPDSDGDGYTDDIENDNGTDPTDAEDHPDPDEKALVGEHFPKAELTVGVGDESGSHSEKWEIVIGNPGGTKPKGQRYLAPDIGRAGTDVFEFERGYYYPVVVNHVVSNYDEPDYDWEAHIDGLGGQTGWTETTCTVLSDVTGAVGTGPMLIYDQDPDADHALLQDYEYHGNDTNLTSGKTAYLILPWARVHEPGDEESDVEPYVETLQKRSGTALEPVIQIVSGGDTSGGGTASLYGAIENETNTWTLKAMVGDGETDQPPEGYTIEWSGAPGLSGSALQQELTISAPGRYYPKLVVRFEGEEVAKAEIHSIVVEDKAEDLVAEAGPAVPDEDQEGEPFAVTHHMSNPPADLEFTMDLRLSMVAQSGTARGRISLDGYPQNEYWVGPDDDEDLGQVVSVEETGTFYMQGYDVPSSGRNDLAVVVEGGWAVSNEPDDILDQTFHELDDSKLTAVSGFAWEQDAIDEADVAVYFDEEEGYQAVESDSSVYRVPADYLTVISEDGSEAELTPPVMGAYSLIPKNITSVAVVDGPPSSADLTTIYVWLERRGGTTGGSITAAEILPGEEEEAGNHLTVAITLPTEAGKAKYTLAGAIFDEGGVSETFRAVPYQVVPGEAATIEVKGTNGGWTTLVDKRQILGVQPDLGQLAAGAAEDNEDGHIAFDFRLSDAYGNPVVGGTPISFDYKPKPDGFFDGIWNHSVRAGMDRCETSRGTDDQGEASLSLFSGGSVNDHLTPAKIFVGVHANRMSTYLGDPMRNLEIARHGAAVEPDGEDALVGSLRVKVQVVDGPPLKHAKVAFLNPIGSMRVGGGGWQYGYVTTYTDANGLTPPLSFTNKYYEEGTLQENPYIYPAEGEFVIRAQVGSLSEEVYTGTYGLPTVPKPVIRINDPFLLTDLDRLAGKGPPAPRLDIDATEGSEQASVSFDSTADLPTDHQGEVEMGRSEAWGPAFTGMRIQSTRNDELTGKPASELPSFEASKWDFSGGNFYEQGSAKFDELFGGHRTRSGFPPPPVKDVEIDGKDYAYIDQYLVLYPESATPTIKDTAAYYGMWEESNAFRFYYINQTTNSNVDASVALVSFHDQSSDPNCFMGVRVGVHLERRSGPDQIEFNFKGGRGNFDASDYDNSNGHHEEEGFVETKTTVTIDDLAFNDVLEVFWQLYIDDRTGPDEDGSKRYWLKIYLKNVTRDKEYTVTPLLIPASILKPDFGQDETWGGGTVRDLKEWPLPRYLFNSGWQGTGQGGGVANPSHLFNSGLVISRKLDESNAYLNGGMTKPDEEVDLSESFGESAVGTELDFEMRDESEYDHSYMQELERVDGHFLGYTNELEVPEGMTPEEVMWVTNIIKARIRTQGRECRFVIGSYPYTSSHVVGEMGAFFKGFFWEDDPRFATGSYGEFIGSMLAVGDIGRIIKFMTRAVSHDPANPPDYLELSFSVVGLVLTLVPPAKAGFKTVLAAMKKEMAYRALAIGATAQMTLSYGMEYAINSVMIIARYMAGDETEGEVEDLCPNY